eukprot:3224995-Rhodomonas_salina.2
MGKTCAGSDASARGGSQPWSQAEGAAARAHRQSQNADPRPRLGAQMSSGKDGNPVLVGGAALAQEHPRRAAVSERCRSMQSGAPNRGSARMSARAMPARTPSAARRSRVEVVHGRRLGQEPSSERRDKQSKEGSQ